jgi:dynein heavy chain
VIIVQVNEAFEELEDGNDDALKTVLERQKAQLSDLIELINGPLSKKNDRKRLITLCTVDVHARDVVQRLIDERVESGQCFQWQSQLRYSQSDKTKECVVNICDAEIKYSNEYIGNPGCLCITPLTDRCYITLTQAQRLILGGAPAGPAGTGKTETTKDLARALGVQCYVFNCSDQMDYKAMGQIFKGLAQTGAWACMGARRLGVAARPHGGAVCSGPAPCASCTFCTPRVRSGCFLPPACRRVQPHPCTRALGVLHPVQDCAGCASRSQGPVYV